MAKRGKNATPGNEYSTPKHHQPAIGPLNVKNTLFFPAISLKLSEIPAFGKIVDQFEPVNRWAAPVGWSKYTKYIL